MSQPAPSIEQILRLEAGAQAVINGALVCAIEPCTLEVAPGAFVLSGHALWPSREALQNPCDELYFSLMDCSQNAGRLDVERFCLFALLSQVVAQDRTGDTHREATRCAAALMAGDAKAATDCAARMASNRMAHKRAEGARGFTSDRRQGDRRRGSIR